jgi:hypothetical protein
MRFASGIAVVLILGGVSLHAQFSGRVAGTVLDATGAAVPDANVELLISGGQKALLTVKTAVDGSYHFIGVRPADYDLTVQAQGFMTATVRKVAVDAARETTVPQIRLQLAAVTQSVEIVADAPAIQTSNAEISSVISSAEMRALPLFDRDPLGMLQTQPGVVYNGNSLTVINGLRTSFSNVTVDGINVQDNYIRDNALDYTPNKILMGQVRQMTVVSSNGNAASFGGATQTAFSTPSGTNQYHGEAIWYNRNNAFSANNWFNNQSDIAKPFLNQNQFGGSLGGPIRRDRAFFYFNYEGLRTRQQVTTTTSILTGPARTGIFSYRDINSGELRSANLLTLRGLTGVDAAIQPILAKVPGPEVINADAVGDTVNVRGYRFNQRDNAVRDNITGAIDYNLSTSQALRGSFSWNRYNSDRPDAENDFSLAPKVTNPTNAKLLALSWRWTPNGRLTNEVRGGFNLTYGYFLTSEQFGPYLLTGFLFSNPVNEFQPQGRNTNTYNFSDDAAYQHGRHFIQFGFHGQKVQIKSFDANGVVPTYSLGMGFGQQALIPRELPGISNSALGQANALLASLGGFVDGFSQTLNVTSRTSGFVPGAAYLRNLRMSDYDFYVQDTWKLSRRLTLMLGLKYQLPGVFDDRESLQLLPVIKGSVVETLLSDATLDFAGKSAGRPFYKRPKKDFAPNVGFAWDVFGTGRTAVRGSYSIHFVNDQEIVAPENMLYANSGLQAFAFADGLSGRVSTGLPKVALPEYRVPLTSSYNYQFNPFNVIGMIDPNLNRPYVQQYSVGVQHDLKGTMLEARYVGNHVVGAYRAFDYNQVEIRQNGFLDDFIRARNNGFLALETVGFFNPNYNGNIPGSQPLTVFPRLARGVLQVPEFVNQIQTGEPGQLAANLTVNGQQGSVSFFPNPHALAADIITNYSHSTYNSLQLVARRRFADVAQFEVNYTLSKVLSDADGDLQARFQAFLDNANPRLERSRANFDQSHMIKSFGRVQLPFGKGHRLSYGPLDRLIGGWRLAGSMIWQSGAPFSITSGRGTLNRTSRSYYNTANTALNKSQLAEVVKFQMTGIGPAIVAESAINPADFTGVNADGEPRFAGQVFSNPDPGTLGSLQRRFFSGPWTFSLDTSLSKRFDISESLSVEFRGDAFNVLNHPTFWSGDHNINSPAFGLIGSTLSSRRIMQYSLTFSF